MKHFVVVSITFLLMSVNTPIAMAAGIIPLWGSTTYGMTLNEVLNANKLIQEVCDKKYNQPLVENSKVLACINPVDIAGADFNAWFKFRDGKLYAVTLSLNKVDSAKELIDTKTLYSKISWLLNAKYGNPNVSTPIPTVIPTISWQQQWVLGLANIDLDMDQTRFDIGYGAQYAEDLSNL